MNKITLDTLSEAYIILADLGLAGLLDGNTFEIQPHDLLNALLRERKLHRFLAIISGETEATVGAWSPSECLEAITSFFVDMSNELRSLPGLITAITPQPSVKA